MHVQPLTHPTLHKAPLTTLPDRLMPNMVAASNLDPYPGMNASFGSSAVVDPLAPQTLDTIPWDVYTDSSGDLWQQQSMLCKNMQAHDTSEHISEENRITGSMTLGVPGHTNGTSRALHWQRDDNGTLAHAQVCVEDQIRDSMTLLWPPDLPLVIHNVGISTLNVQEWIQKNHAPVSRINCAPGTDNRDFNDLVKSLRNWGGYATAWWEAGGSYQARLLLAPLGTHLLCVAFPVKGVPEPPTSRLLEPDHMKRSVALSSWTRYSLRPASLTDPLVVPAFPERPYHEATHGTLIPQQALPQRWTQPQPQAEYHPLDTTEPVQVDLNLFVPGREAIMFPPVCVTPPSHLQLGQQGFSQAPLQQPNAQQSQQVATSNMLSGGSEPDGWQMDAGATSWWFVYPSDGLGTILPLEGNSGTCLDIGENTTSYFTDVDMDAIFGDTDAFESGASADTWISSAAKAGSRVEPGTNTERSAT